MKNKLLLLLLQVSFFGCQSPGAEAEEQENVAPTVSVAPVVQTAASGENKEYLDWQSIRINGKYPLATAVSDINSLFVKPDSVSAINWDETCFSSFRSRDSELAYYGGLQFEQFSDSLSFQSVDFRDKKDVFLQANNITLSSSTTLEEVKMHFPNAVKDVERLNVHNLGEVEVISLPPFNKLSGRHWLLMFRNGNLIRIEDWFPC